VNRPEKQGQRARPLGREGAVVVGVVGVHLLAVDVGGDRDAGAEVRDDETALGVRLLQLQGGALGHGPAAQRMGQRRPLDSLEPGHPRDVAKLVGGFRVDEIGGYAQFLGQLVPDERAEQGRMQGLVLAVADVGGDPWADAVNAAGQGL
jgi:hypothetical protein